MDQAITKTIPAPIKHPASLPIATVNAVLLSLNLDSFNFCHSYPSKTPAIPSVIAFPTNAPTTAPKIPKILHPIK